MNIERFKSDHNTIMASIKELRELVADDISANADKIATSLINMSAKIKLHLSTEDMVLYPVLLSSTIPDVAKVGAAFKNEMGGLSQIYKDFSGKWNIANKIVADPLAFRQEANVVFKALHERIQRENTLLYPLAEKV